MLKDGLAAVLYSTCYACVDDVVIAVVIHYSQRSLDERSEESSIRSDVDRPSIVSPMTKLK